MKFLRLALIPLLASLPAIAFAQDFDDIYFDPKTDTPRQKDPKTTTNKSQPQRISANGEDARRLYYQMTDYAPADTYQSQPTSAYQSTRSVDEYNRRGIFAATDVDSTASATDSVASADPFACTRRISRFHNPSVASNDEIVAEYLATSTSPEVNIYIGNPPYYNYDPWNYWSGYGYLPGFYMNSWALAPYWAWRPGWAWNWGPAWGPSWGWGPSWAWNPSWGWGPSWGWAGGYYPPTRPSWGNHRPGHGVHHPQRPSSGLRPGARPGSRPSGGNWHGRPSGDSNSRPSYGRPGANGNRGDYRPSSGNNRDNGSYSRPGRNGRNNSTSTPSYNRGGSRSNGGFSGGGSRGGGSRGGGSRGRH